jgi:hypothetical protein
MEFKGNAWVEEFSSYLKGESARCIAIVAAAFFDETLGSLLGDTKERSFQVRINDARGYGLLTQNEFCDLNAIRCLRNRFATTCGQGLSIRTQQAPWNRYSCG